MLAPLLAVTLALQPSVLTRAISPSMAAEATVAPACDFLLRGLFTGVIDPDAVAGACSADVVWDDLTLKEPIEGRAAVRRVIADKFPKDARLVIERLSDGQQSGGFTWHREAVTADGSASPTGLRGTLYAELNDAGQLTYVREASEPILKPGEATEALLKAATANMDQSARTAPSYKQATPTTASSIAKYLWTEAYPGGASPSEALRLFSDAIVYEDFNYPDAFVGIPAVTEFVNAFDIPGIDFVPLKISEGERACAFTWKVLVNGQDGPQGLSFYEVDANGKVSCPRFSTRHRSAPVPVPVPLANVPWTADPPAVRLGPSQVCYIRDIPAPSPRGFRPLGALATELDPVLRVFTSETLSRAALGIASSGMGLLKPAFAAEARWQADTLGDEGARVAAAEQLDEAIASAPVVVYTYKLSPFSTEALALLDATGCEYKNVELGLEWFLLDGVGSAIRATLLERHGMSSLPHVFIGGESVGGLFSGNEAGVPGLVELKQRGELTGMLKAAGAL